MPRTRTFTSKQLIGRGSSCNDLSPCRAPPCVLPCHLLAPPEPQSQSRSALERLKSHGGGAGISRQQHLSICPMSSMLWVRIPVPGAIGGKKLKMGLQRWDLSLPARAVSYKQALTPDSRSPHRYSSFSTAIPFPPYKALWWQRPSQMIQGNLLNHVWHIA